MKTTECFSLVQNPRVPFHLTVASDFCILILLSNFFTVWEWTKKECNKINNKSVSYHQNMQSLPVNLMVHCVSKAHGPCLGGSSTSPGPVLRAPRSLMHHSLTLSQAWRPGQGPHSGGLWPSWEHRSWRADILPFTASPMHSSPGTLHQGPHKEEQKDTLNSKRRSERSRAQRLLTNVQAMVCQHIFRENCWTP